MFSRRRLILIIITYIKQPPVRCYRCSLGQTDKRGTNQAPAVGNSILINQSWWRSTFVQAVMGTYQGVFSLWAAGMVGDIVRSCSLIWRCWELDPTKGQPTFCHQKMSGFVPKLAPVNRKQLASWPLYWPMYALSLSLLSKGDITEFQINWQSRGSKESVPDFVRVMGFQQT